MGDQGEKKNQENKDKSKTKRTRAELPQIFLVWPPQMLSCCFPMQRQQRASFVPCLTVSASLTKF
jgi:hypothetical protein